MTNQELMYKFISNIYSNGLITNFLINIFNYKNLNEYNYIFRLSVEGYYVIIDLFDNISENRFNRYFFDFSTGKKTMIINKSSNIFVTHIKVLKVSKDGSNLLKLAYLFKLKKSRMINFAYKFLDDEFVEILKQFI